MNNLVQQRVNALLSNDIPLGQYWYLSPLTIVNFWGYRKPSASYSINPYYAEFILAEIEICLISLISKYRDRDCVCSCILPHERQGSDYSAESIPWLLVAWRYREPGHQQLWYWPSYPGTFVFQQKKGSCFRLNPQRFLSSIWFLAHMAEPAVHAISCPNDHCGDSPQESHIWYGCTNFYRSMNSLDLIRALYVHIGIKQASSEVRPLEIPQHFQCCTDQWLMGPGHLQVPATYGLHAAPVGNLIWTWRN